MNSHRPLRIALATSSFFPRVGGAEVTVHNLARFLQSQGHQVVVFISWRYWRSLGKDRSKFGYRILPLPPVQQRGLRWFGRAYPRIHDLYLAWMQRRYRFDVWQSFGAFPIGVLVSHFTSKRNLPHVMRTVGYDIQKDDEIGYGYRLDPRIDRLIRDWIPRSSKVIALSESVVPDLLEVGVPPENVVIVPCAVDQARFMENTVDRVAVRRRYGIPPDVFCYITVGRNHPKKGFKYLLEAAAELRRSEQSPFHVVFVGRGMSDLAPRSNELGLDGHVTFIDELGLDPEDREYRIPSAHLVSLYRSADACVFPSLIETFALINIEAMAAMLPVISTDAPGCRETITHGFDGLVAKAGDSADLAAKMAELLDSDTLRARLRENGSQTVTKNYTWDVVGRQFESMYSKLARSG